MRSFWIPALILGCGWFCSPSVNGQEKQEGPEAQWIWFDEGNPVENAPAGKVWFRKEVRGHGPSTGQIRVACDDAFELWVNGQKIGSGKAGKSYRFNLNGIVERGINVIAIEAVNESGKAGLYVDGVIRDQGGSKIPFVSGADWKVTRDPVSGEAWKQPRFDEAAWKTAKALGNHASSPWKEISVTDTAEDRFDVPPGFAVKQLATPDLAGSVIAITWGNRGRLIVSREQLGIYSLVDENGDGVYDEAIEYSSAVTSCQGLCVVNDDLYAVGMGPNKQAGLYRLPDADHDDKADTVEELMIHKGGIGEHGPHDVIFAPDGWLYHNLGNHAWVMNTPEKNSPAGKYEEGYLLEPRFEDANGHAAGIKAPGGTIWRFTPDGKQWWLETNGFRNEYDIAMNSRGDLFSYDSDMEWDVNLPWYRPVRIYHCPPGAEFGWRSGAAKTPAYMFDLLPPTIDTGRGSPTGVAFYEHTQFPEKYRGTMLNCDWSMGRILVAKMTPKGATYEGTYETLVSGNPLNVSDIEVDQDGTVVFSTGGRRTEGGIYRVVYEGEGASVKKATAKTIEDALALPQLQANWAREMVNGIKAAAGDQWEKTLAKKVAEGTPSEKVRALTLLAQFGPKPTEAMLVAAAGDADATVRQFAIWLLGDYATPAVVEVLTKSLGDADPTVQRRACEAFVRNGSEAPADAVLKLLASPDRFVRFAARLTLERIPVEKWQEKVLASKNGDVRILGLYALHRYGGEKFPAERVLEEAGKVVLEGRLSDDAQVNRRMKLDALRLLQFGLMGKAKGVDLQGVQAKLVTQFQTAMGSQRPKDDISEATMRETARLLCAMNVGEATPLIVQTMTASTDLEAGLHYALCLRYMKSGWDFHNRLQLLNWYETTKDWEGGNSLQGYVRNVVSGICEGLSPEDRKEMLTQWQQRPHATRLLLSISTPENVQDFDQVVGKLLTDVEQMPGHASLQELVSLTIEALGKSDSESARETLRKLYEAYPDRREQLARQLCLHPDEASWPQLVKALSFGDGTTMQQCLKALSGLERKPETADEFRAAILAGLKLNDQGGLLAADLLQIWTGAEHHSGKDLGKALAFYQGWFLGRFPQAAPAVLPQIDIEKTRYGLDQLVQFLNHDSKGQAGDAARGKAIFTKANCIKCHRFKSEGEGIGPDLTTVRKRFQRKEIVESILTPSQVISDQYKSVTINTKAGLVHSGMPVPNTGNNDAVILLLSDATRITIPKDDIEELVPAKVSVMPEGLLKELSLEEIADLFAFIETSKQNEEPGQRAAK